MAIITFKPKQVTKKLLGVLSERACDIVTKRYGLDKTEKMTLEAIGKEYGITRERVRQIEEHSLNNIRKSDDFAQCDEHLLELEEIIYSLGGIVSEQELLEHVSSNQGTQNHVHFLLVLGHKFERMREDEHFEHRWSIDADLASDVHDSLKKVYANLDNDEIVSESELINSFLDHLKDVNENLKNEEVMKRWLKLSKKIDKNPLGEWGRADSPNINVKGMRDYAYLVIRRHGSPIHFREVADTICNVFDKKAHVATCHNELIKDSRFVLVGRGLYALKEWGYSTGVVRDVISEILEKNGPLTRDEIVDKVMKERYVKENTIVVNLQNPKYFSKDDKGCYHLA